ncbi:MAG: flagellar export chaperone FliS [Planctomycetota bacterium]
MSADTAKKYLETQIRTASREQLLLLMYDGAIRFCEKAVHAMREARVEESHAALIKAQGVLMELMCSLDQAVQPEFSKRLFSLYNFWYLRLVEANLHRDAARVEGVLAMLRPLRRAWAEAVEKIRSDGGGGVGAKTPVIPAVPATSSLNLQG